MCFYILFCWDLQKIKPPTIYKTKYYLVTERVKNILSWDEILGCPKRQYFGGTCTHSKKFHWKSRCRDEIETIILIWKTKLSKFAKSPKTHQLESNGLFHTKHYLRDLDTNQYLASSFGISYFENSCDAAPVRSYEEDRCDPQDQRTKLCGDPQDQRTKIVDLDFVFRFSSKRTPVIFSMVACSNRDDEIIRRSFKRYFFIGIQQLLTIRGDALASWLLSTFLKHYYALDILCGRRKMFPLLGPPLENYIPVLNDLVDYAAERRALKRLLYTDLKGIVNESQVNSFFLFRHLMICALQNPQFTVKQQLRILSLLIPRSSLAMVYCWKLFPEVYSMDELEFLALTSMNLVSIWLLLQKNIVELPPFPPKFSDISSASWIPFRYQKFRLFANHGTPNLKLSLVVRLPVPCIKIPQCHLVPVGVHVHVPTKGGALFLRFSEKVQNGSNGIPFYQY